MSGPETGALFAAFMLLMMFVRVPIGLSMALAGSLGYVFLSGWSPLLSYLKTSPYYQMGSVTLSVIPLFLLMGQLSARAGVSRALFAFANAFLGHRRGGLCIAAIGGCAMFGAICGSSLATAATMGQVALPEMKKYGYKPSLATGTLAAGGTLGILIPPSIVLIVYAILTEQNIAKLFLAAFIPGLLAMLGYMAAISVFVRFFPEAGPARERADRREKLRALFDMLPVCVLFVIVLGGIYAGVFTPDEAAAFGAAGAALIAFTLGGMRFDGFIASIAETAVGTGMIFLILIGADIFNAFLALTGMPQALATLIGESGLSPYLVLLAMLLSYLLLGCLMDSLSMVLLTIPIFFPVVMGLDFGMTPEQTAIWFGIVVLVVVELGLITPPVGMNVFVINKLAGDVPMMETFKGVIPFLTSDFIRVALLITFPVITIGVLRLID